MSSSSTSSSYRVCCCFWRTFRLGALDPPKDVMSVFNDYSVNGVMGVEQVQRFLVEVQREPAATKEDAQAVLESLREFKHLGVMLRKGLNLDAFFRYLFLDHNLAVSPSSRVHQDMDAPLSHYYIYTSHNSYLTGNQLSSDCSDVPIKEALLRGVRVIELDMWPNVTKDNIAIYHGRTLTTPVELIRCLKTIKEYAFAASPYPVIITLEDHLTPDLQEKVAHMIRQTFGDLLFTPKHHFEVFPSPESLKNRILVSTKPPKEFLETKRFSPPETKGTKSKTKDSMKEERWGQEVLEFETEVEADDKTDQDHDEEDSDDGNRISHKQKAPEYKDLIAIHAGKGKGSMKESLMDDHEKVRRLSMSEQKLEKAIMTHGTDIVRFTQRNLLRVYPRGTRFNSSNYNPLVGWMHGAQMVAFNMQGHGRALWLMQGMFRANGGCGYVKKPEFLLTTGPNGEVFNPREELPVQKILKVKVYMGDGWRFDFRRTHFDYYSPPDFYTRVGIAGVGADSVMKKTRTIEDTWIPVWNEVFTFPLRVPELALLRIEVHEYDMTDEDDFAGQTCLPVSELRTGIRAVPLFRRNGEKFKSVKLLMKFDFV